MKVIALSLTVLLLGVSVVFAQDEGVCPALVQTALASVGDACGGLDRNTACYGNNRVDATFWEPREDLVFRKPADRVPLLDVQSVATAPLDVDQNLWGVAVMNVQANVPETLPGQAVTFLLMGDAVLENVVSPDEAAAPVTAVAATVKSGANLRSLPTTKANVIGGAAAGDEILLVGVNDAGDWYEVSREDGGSAWIWGELIAAEDAGAFGSLPVTYGQGVQTRYGPMQAFYFTTGLGTPVCREAPNALAVQSPTGIKISLNINGLKVTLASTVIFTTTEFEGDRVLVGTLIEGTFTAYYEAFTTELTQPGQSFAVTLNQEGLVDEQSQVIDLSGSTAVETAVQFGCQSLLTSDLLENPLEPSACQVTPGYHIPEPETGGPPDLADVSPDAACTVAAINPANLRSGPGTNFPWSGQLAADERAYPDGQATGTDGLMWWQLSSGYWVRSDVVAQAGACAAIPVVAAPAPPAPAPLTNVSYYEIGHGLGCDDLNRVRAGQTIGLQIGIGRWPTPEAMEAALAGHSASITVDGVALPVFYEGPTWHEGMGTPPGYGNRAQALWVAVAGKHTASAVWTYDGAAFSCVFTVAP